MVCRKASKKKKKKQCFSYKLQALISFKNRSSFLLRKDLKGSIKGCIQRGEKRKTDIIILLHNYEGCFTLFSAI